MGSPGYSGFNWGISQLIRALTCLSIRRTKFKNVIVLLQFPEQYPNNGILVELKSKTLPPRLLSKMMELCDQEAKKFLGKPQVSGVVSSQHLVLEDYHTSVWNLDLTNIVYVVLSHFPGFCWNFNLNFWGRDI